MAYLLVKLIRVRSALTVERLRLTTAALLSARKSPRLVSAACAEILTLLAGAHAKVRRRHLVPRRQWIALLRPVAAQGSPRIRVSQRLGSAHLLFEIAGGRDSPEMHISRRRLKVELLCFICFKHF